MSFFNPTVLNQVTVAGRSIRKFIVNLLFVNISTLFHVFVFVTTEKCVAQENADKHFLFALCAWTDSHGMPGAKYMKCLNCMRCFFSWTSARNLLNRSYCTNKYESLTTHYILHDRNITYIIFPVPVKMSELVGTKTNTDQWIFVLPPDDAVARSRILRLQRQLLKPHGCS